MQITSDNTITEKDGTINTLEWMSPQTWEYKENKDCLNCGNKGIWHEVGDPLEVVYRCTNCRQTIIIENSCHIDPFPNFQDTNGCALLEAKLDAKVLKLMQEAEKKINEQPTERKN